MYQSGEIKAILDRVIARIETQSFATHGRSQTYQQWFKAAEDARNLLLDAKKSFKSQPIEVVVIDLDRLERDIIKSYIDDKDVQGLLPFQTEIVAGENYFHIVNQSGYIVETKYHVIPKGATICARGMGDANGPTLGPIRGVIPTCPGCVAKSKNIVATYLQERVTR